MMQDLQTWHTTTWCTGLYENIMLGREESRIWDGNGGMGKLVSHRMVSYRKLP
jgi:hypothetical protein